MSSATLPPQRGHVSAVFTAARRATNGTTPRAHATLFSKAKGCEQGDALAPALDALGQHDGLLAAQADLQEGGISRVFFFFFFFVADDLRMSTQPERARIVLDSTTRHVPGPTPPGIAELGPDVWRGDNLARSAWSSSRLRSVAVGMLLPDSLPVCAPGGLHPRCGGSLAPAGVGAGGSILALPRKSVQPRVPRVEVVGQVPQRLHFDLLPQKRSLFKASGMHTPTC